MSDKAKEIAKKWVEIPPISGDYNFTDADVIDMSSEIDQAMRGYAIEKLREAAKRSCDWCERPIELKCSVASIHQGIWKHYSMRTTDPWDGCDAGPIHDLIAEIEGEQ